MIRIAVVDDHHALREGLAAVLDAQPDLETVGGAAGEQDLWPLLRRTDPDLVLLDYHLPDSDGLTLCRRIKAAGAAPRVLLYSAFASPALSLPAILAGADGLVAKEVSPDELFAALRRVAEGERLFPRPPAEIAKEAERRLSPDDAPVLRALLAGDAVDLPAERRDAMMEALRSSAG